MDKHIEESLVQLQSLEQNVQNTALQRQNIQGQLLEIENALRELKKTKEAPYKVIGSLMIISSKEDIQKDLESKQEMLKLRMGSLEKQEAKVKERIQHLQQEIMTGMKKEEVK